jgi:hypothetical protein
MMLGAAVTMTMSREGLMVNDLRGVRWFRPRFGLSQKPTPKSTERCQHDKNPESRYRGAPGREFSTLGSRVHRQTFPVRLSPAGCSFQFGRTSILFPRLPHFAHFTRERYHGLRCLLDSLTRRLDPDACRRH